ncbi:MAG: tetratricopeptide repeat protein, partial [Elainellaceae cyanobacterium]
MLELLSGLLLDAVVSVLGNRTDAGVCRAVVGLWKQVRKPTPENHDLQRALLEALRDGLETTARKGLKSLARAEAQQVERWLKQQVKAINQEIQLVRRGHGSQMGGDEDWGALLRATPEELAGMGQRQVNSQLRQLKAGLEQQLQLATLPAQFRDDFEAEWLAWVNLYLAESIKTNPRVAEVLQVNLLLDVQSGVQQLTEALSNPQRFLGAVQLIDFNIQELRGELEGWQQSLTGHLEALKDQVGEGFSSNQQRFDEVMELLLRMQGAGPQRVSTNVITVPPNLEHWLGRESEMGQLLAWVADSATDTIGIQGLGGVGKSALAARLYHETQNWEATFWADVSQQPNFEAFAEQVLVGMGDYSRGQVATLDPTQFVNLLLGCLNRRRCLLVVDNLESLLDGERGWVEPGYAQFFERWVQQGKTSVLVMTTQDKPMVFQGEPHWLMVQGMAAESGGQLLQALGIQGELSDLETFAAAVDGHPLTLYLVAGFLREYCGGLLSGAAELGLAEFNQLADAAVGSHRSQREVRRAWVLQQHLDRLTPDLRQFLLRLSVYRQAFDRQAAAFMLGQDSQPADALATQIALQELVNRSLVMSTEERQYQILPFITAYLAQQQDDLQDAHGQAVFYYESIAAILQSWTSLSDLSAHLEVFYHRCEQKQYDLAYDVLQSCLTFLDLRGYSTLLVELYGQLLDGHQRLGYASSLSSSQHLWALLSLGNAHHALSQYAKAIEYYEQNLAIAREIGDRRGEGNALGGLGNAYDGLSQYAKAIEYHEQRLAIAREVGDCSEEGRAL